MKHLLTATQNQVVVALSTGASLSAAAQAAGISRSTIYSWLNDPLSVFSKAIDLAKQQFADSLRDQLHDAAVSALHALIAILNDPKASPSVKLKASLAILTRTDSGKKVWNLPQYAETELNTSEQNFEDLPEPKSEPIRVNKIGRNDFCPCGSGLKFKKCCLNKPANPQNSLLQEASHFV